LYSIFRRSGKRSPTTPDRLHLHTLVFRRCIWRLLPRDDRRPWMRNAAVTALVAPWTAAWTVAVVALGSSGALAVLLLGVHALAYVVVHMRLVRGHWGFHFTAISRRRSRAARARLAWPTQVD
jgi:hypothetical protein